MNGIANRDESLQRRPPGSAPPRNLLHGCRTIHRHLGAFAAVILLFAALGGAFNGCSVIGNIARGGVERVNSNPPVAASSSHILIFALDGAGYHQLMLAIHSGKANRLKDLLGAEGLNGVFEHGYSVPDAISILPSTTIAAWSSVFTGQPPAYTGVPGNEWFVREQMHFYAPAPVSTTDTADTEKMITEDLVGKMIRVPTLYELVGLHSNVSLSQVYRGATFYTTLEPSAIVDMTAAFLKGVVGAQSIRREIYANIDQDSVTRLIAEISDKGLPDLQIVYFPGIDLYTHLASDPLTQQLEYLETVTDPSIGRVLDSYENLGALNDTYVILIADHGHTPVLNDAQHALGTTSENTPTTLIARAGFRLRPLLLNPPSDQQDYQAVVTYQGAMAFIYLADRSTCAPMGSRCDWSRPPRFRQDVRPILRAFYRVNERGRPIPQLKGTLDLIFSREPTPSGANALPFEIFDGTKLIPISEYLAKHPRPDLVDLDQRMQWLGSGPHGNRAGDIVLLARSGLNRSLEDRYYSSGPYHSWHGSPSEQDSHVPFVVARKRDSGATLRALVGEVVHDSHSQLNLVPLVQKLARK